MSLGDDLQAISTLYPRQPPVEDNLFPVYAEFGIDRHHHGSDSDKDRLSILRKWITFASEGESHRGVFMDNTSLYSAFSLIQSRGTTVLSANTLFDLDMLVRCLVLYDNVFHLDTEGALRPENPIFDSRVLNELLGNEAVVIPIPVDPGPYNDGVSAALTDLFDEVEIDAAKIARPAGSKTIASQREAIRWAWQLVLGRSVAATDLDNVNARDSNWASDGPYLVEKLLNQLGPDDEEVVGSGLTTLGELISESNARSLFNTRVAGMLGLPYAPNTTRVPYRMTLLKTAVAATDSMQDLREIQELFDEYATGYLRPESIEIPILLTAVLARAHSLDAFFSELAELRLRATAYRCHRRELLDAVRNRNKKSIDKLRIAVRDDAGKLPGAVVGGAGAVVLGSVAALGHGFAPWIIGGIKGMLGLDQEKRRLLGRRLFRPEEWFVSRLVGTASELINAAPTIAQIWEGTDLDFLSRRLHEMSVLDQAWPQFGAATSIP